MRVVSDTTAITTLLKAGWAHLLRDLFAEVLIPPAVHDELRAFHREIPAFVLLRTLPETDLWLPEAAALGRGESEALWLAKEIGADLLLTDDRKAAAAAGLAGLKCSGLLGILLLAKRRNLITSVRETIVVLERDGGLYLSETVRAEAIRLAGE